MSKLDELRARVESDRKKAQQVYGNQVYSSVSRVLTSDTAKLTYLNQGITNPEKQQEELDKVVKNVSDAVINSITDVKGLFLDTCKRRNFCEHDIRTAVDFISENCSGKSLTRESPYEDKLEFTANYLAVNEDVWEKFDCLAPIP